MTYPIKLRIFDQHEDRETDGWLRFDFVFDVAHFHITCFREFVLFDYDNNPTKCTQIFFNDGECVYGCYSIEKFTEIYENEYKPIYSEMMTARMLFDGKIEDDPKRPGPLRRIWNWLW